MVMARCRPLTLNNCSFHSDALLQSLRKGHRPSGSFRSPRGLDCESVCTVMMGSRSAEADG